MNPQTITLGGGCFWCTEAVFEQVDGVLAVESGYSNGHVASPSYEQVCTGTTGTLMTKPMRRRRKAHDSSVMPQNEVAAKGEFCDWPIAASARRLKVWTGFPASWAEWMAVSAAVLSAPSRTGLTT